MTNTEQKQAIVTKGVKAQASIDKSLATAHRAAQQYAKAIEEAVKSGFFSSGLEAKRMLAEARALPGKIAEAAQLAAVLHQSGTMLAVENEVDLGTVTNVGGVEFVKKSGGFTTMGGGGR